MMQTLKYLHDNEPEKFRRLQGFVQDMEHPNPSRAVKQRENWRGQTVPKNNLQWDELVEAIAEDLARNRFNTALAILHSRKPT